MSRSTTERLESLCARHGRSIESAVDRLGLPLHVLFVEEMERNARGFLDVGAAMYPKTIVAFAAKSNPCRGAIRAAKRFGLGVDAASEYELRAALEEGIDPMRITCNGNAKSDAYLRDAIEAGAIVAVDNEDELRRLETLARERSVNPPILVRFRGMPLSGFTSEDQTTASDWTKFGFHIDESSALFERLKASPLSFAGISAHIGTQIASSIAFERLLSHLFEITDVARGVGLEVRIVDIGGGFPVRFLEERTWQEFLDRLLRRLQGDAPVDAAVTWGDLAMGFERTRSDEHPRWVGKAYWTAHPMEKMLNHLLGYEFEDGRTTVDKLRDLGEPTLIVEPGRSLMASAGVTLCEVMGVKRVHGHHVVSLDLGINNHGTNLISPDIFPAAVLPTRDDDREAEAFLAGRLCFSGDMISKAKTPLNRLPERGERFVVYHTGAYAADHFASQSCGFPRPAKVAIGPDGAVEVWRRPDTFEDVFGSPDDPLTA
jgi:diaminopimelate decarboxylase